MKRKAGFCSGPHLRGFSQKPMCGKWPLPMEKILSHSKPVRMLALTSEGQDKQTRAQAGTHLLDVSAFLTHQCLSASQVPCRGFNVSCCPADTKNFTLIFLYGHRDWLFLQTLSIKQVSSPTPHRLKNERIKCPSFKNPLSPDLGLQVHFASAVTNLKSRRL